MEEKMCQQRKSTSKHTQTKYLYQQSPQNTAAGHKCKMCSSFSTSSSSSSSTSSSSSSSFSPSSTMDSHSRRQSFDKKNNNGCFLEHLQSMIGLLRREETLKMAVRLESAHHSRTRYLVVVCRIGRSQLEECCLLGIDRNKRTTVGLVLKVLADTAITLDGDGGFSVSVCGRQHIFKPVSVQAMWSALQTLYKVSTKAREYNYFEKGNTHDWVSYYEQSIESNRSCLNEWHTMSDIESRRPPSPDSLRSKPGKRLETEQIIRSTLKEIMMSVDLDEVTSKYIRSRLEEQLDMDLREFKSFIDEEMLVILGQMDAATEIFPHVYLGSEWNASNLEELNKNGISKILNVSREIDNFFPGTFEYLNIRVYDDDNTNLLKHWDNTYKFINNAKKPNAKVLVHCKMGISRSASVVIAYAMKAYNWDFKKAFEYVRKKRTCIKPNQNFINQLETYQGILDAMKNKEKLQRSKSETNLKSSATKTRFHARNKKKREEHNSLSEPPVINEKTIVSESDYGMLRVNSGVELAQLSMRPKSWSPDNLIVSEIFSSTGTMSQSLEQLNSCKLSTDSHSSSASSLSISPPRIPPAPPLPPLDSRYNLNVLMPCGNGLAYSVSQNKIVQLYSAQNQSHNAETSNKSDAFEPKTSFSGVKKYDAPSSMDSNPFVLQIPSQFQGNLYSFNRREHVNLVKKDISPNGDTVSVKPSSSSPAAAFVAPREGGDNLCSQQQRAFTRKGEIPTSIEQNFGDSRTTTVSCYQKNDYENLLLRSLDADVIVVPQSDANSANIFNNNDQSIKIYPLQPTTATSSNVISTVQFLERLKDTRTSRVNVSAVEKEDETSKGLVQNLKKEFEAKCNVFDKNKQHKRCSLQGDSNNNDDNDVRCFTNSPAVEASHADAVVGGTNTPLTEVRKLVGKYEVAECNKEQLRFEKKQQPPIPPRKSSLEIKFGSKHPSASVLPHPRYKGVPHLKSWLNKSNDIRSTVTKAANILQQNKPFIFGKSQSSPNSVYNTV